MILKDWEVQTIEALANEALERTSADTEIRRPDLWLDKAIGDRQRDATTNEVYRRQLRKHSERLGIGYVHPKHDWSAEEHEVADADTVNRWGRVTRLVFGLPDDHPWKAVYRDVVTTPLVESRHTTGWDVPDGGIGILDFLEDEAQSQGLIGFEDAEPITVAELLTVMVSHVGPKERIA